MKSFLKHFGASRPDCVGRSTLFQGQESSSRPLAFSAVSAIHASERLFTAENPVHSFEVSTNIYSEERIHEHLSQTALEPSVFTPEKYRLFDKYQTEIHHDKKNTALGFKRFLVDSPLRVISLT